MIAADTEDATLGVHASAKEILAVSIAQTDFAIKDLLSLTHLLET